MACRSGAAETGHPADGLTDGQPREHLGLGRFGHVVAVRPDETPHRARQRRYARLISEKPPRQLYGLSDGSLDRGSIKGRDLDVHSALEAVSRDPELVV